MSYRGDTYSFAAAHRFAAPTDPHVGRDFCAARYAACCTSRVASSHRRYEGDVESSDDPHEVDYPIVERPQIHAVVSNEHEEIKSNPVPLGREALVRSL